MEKKPIKVNVQIFGRNYTIKTTESEDYIKSIAYHLDDKMRTIAKIDSRMDFPMISTLVAVNLYDDYLTSLSVADNLRKQVASYIENLKKAESEIKKLKEKVATNEKKANRSNKEEKPEIDEQKNETAS